MGRGPPQQRRPGRHRGIPCGPGVEPAVGGEQFIGAQPRIQALGEGLLPDPVGVDLGGDEGVGAALGQRDHPGLRERRTVVPGPGVAELGGVLVAVGHVDLEPVDPQQPPPAQKRPPRGAQRHVLRGHTRLTGDRAAGAFEQLREHIAAQALAGLGDRRGGRHRPGRPPTVPAVQRPGDLGRDLFVVVLREQAQRQRQIRDHMRGQLGVRTLLPHPASDHGIIDRVPGHSVDQDPQRHLIRSHHHTLAHDRRPCQPHNPRRSRHAAPIKDYQVSHVINLGYVALRPGPADVPRGRQARHRPRAHPWPRRRGQPRARPQRRRRAP